MDQEQALSISRVAKRLDVCDRTARRIVASGDLKAHRIRGRWRIFEADLKEYLAKTVNRSAA